MSHSEKLNAVYSSLSMKRRYEVWFLRCGLADGSGAWWFRYLLFNPGRKGCPSYFSPSCSSYLSPCSMPVQVWATWFPRHGAPSNTFIQGFPLDSLQLSARRETPFFFRAADCGIEDGLCWGDLRLDGHSLSWKLRYHSTFGAVLSHKGWIGFSQSPHSNALFSGEIVFDGQTFTGDPLGFGVQGHNCGYRHRTFWRWMHVYLLDGTGKPSTLEALVYDMPLGMTFRNAIWWNNGKPARLHRIQEREIVNKPDSSKWAFAAKTAEDSPVEVTVEASAPHNHHLPYTKTDCSGAFPVTNASLARAQIRFGRNLEQILETATGAVLEFGGV
jgi:hypothetical protein